MPEMDGYSALTLLKDMEKTRNIPVIFITGLTNAEDEEKGLSMGAVDYISKPFSPTIVKLRVQNQIKMLEQLKVIKQQLQLIHIKDLAEKSNRAKSEFLSRMSHEMRTPMNTIMGMTSIAKETDNERERANYLREIENASAHLLQLIDNLLDMSSLNKNTLKFEHSEFSFSAMLNSVLEVLKLCTEEKEQALTLEIDPKMPDELIGDKGRLAQVIRALLINANKFTPEYGKIWLNVSMLGIEGKIATIQIEVKDNGVGISKEKQATIFQSFEQVDGSKTRSFGGVGLGLATSGQIAEMMGGNIFVESEVNCGAKFTFIFRVEIASA
jgi:signal transduction histidine kinase